MIIAKTGMSEVPERCGECRFHSCGWCNLETALVKKATSRPSWCPLEEIESLEKGSKP